MCTCSCQKCLYSLTQIFWEYSKDESVKRKGFKDIYSLGGSDLKPKSLPSEHKHTLICNYAGITKKLHLILGFELVNKVASAVQIVVFQTACNLIRVCDMMMDS